MCGIIFILKKNENYKTENDVIESIASRGPDDKGIIEIKNMIFMHTRLSIQLLTTNGYQPMTYNDNIIVYNGEIYNCKELKEKYNVDYDLDTDFILKLYDKYKDIFFSEIVQQFDGIFSFIIYDGKKEKIFICRDLFGVKPLFLSETDDYLCISSSIKTLLSITEKREIINENIYDFFNLRQCMNGETIMKNIYDFTPGNYMEYNVLNYEKKCEKYIELEDKSLNLQYSEKILEEKINDSIKKNMICDKNVKIGCFVSGGVDSSYIYKLCKSLKSEFYSYSIGFENCNEFGYVDMVVNKKYHKNITVSMDEYLENMVELINNKGYLLNVPNEVLISIISKQAKKDGVKILLAGEGADEIFHGYGRIFNSYMGIEREDFFDLFTEKYKYNKDDKIFNFEPNLQKIKDFFMKFDDKNDHLQNIISKIFLNFHIMSLTNRLDSASMHNSIEARTPFLNQSLVKYVYNCVPREEKIKKKYDENTESNYEELSEIKDIPKYCFKKVAENMLPHKIIYRKKLGFPVPIEDINNRQIYRLILKIINEGYLNKYDIFDMEHIKKLISEESCDLKYIIFNIINIEIFIQLFLEKIKLDDVKKFICQYEHVIGYTCGVFDLFHVGHLNILKKAKRMCDHLIVAVTKDDLVSYKGKTAFINEKDRLEIVRSCKYVDEVIYQEDHDKFEAWKKLKYDILFVGSDWKGNSNWKKWEKQLKDVGKQIIYIPYTEEISSTIIRNNLIKNNEHEIIENKLINKYKGYNFLIPKDKIFNMTVFLKLIIQFFDDNNIEYVAYGGTLLGVIRNNGLIPWDDDIDLFICEKDEEKLISLIEYAMNYGLKIIYEPIDKFGKKNKTFIIYELYNESNIFCDIFIMKINKNYIEYASEYYLKNFPNREIFLDELYPIQKKNIHGCIDINILNNYDKYFTRCDFGEYNKIAKIYPKHTEKTKNYEFKDEKLATFSYYFTPESIIDKCDEIIDIIKDDLYDFDVDYYRNINTDLIDYTNMDLKYHYLYFGKYEGRKKNQNN